MPARRLAAIALALLALATSCGDARTSATFELEPVEAGGPLALAELRLADGELTGRVVGWGFAPGTQHAVLLGEGRCPPRPAPRAPLAFPRLIANANGVAFGRLRSPAAPDAALAAGRILVVYAGPAPRCP